IGTQSGKVGILEVAANGVPKWLAQHSGRITSLAFTRAGSQLASAGQDGMVKVIDLANGAVKDLHGHHGKVWTVAYSPKGEFLASGGDDKTVIVWDPVGGKELYRLTNGGNKPIKLVFFREGGTAVTSVIAVGEGGVISEWDVKNRSLLRQIQESDKTVLSASTNFSVTHLSIGTEFSDLQKGTFTFHGPVRPTDLYREDRIKLYDLENGKVAKTLDGINGEVKSIAVSADNRYIAAARVRTTESFVGVFDLQRGTEIFSRPLPGGAQAVAFSADGRWLSAASGNGEITVLKVQGIQPSGMKLLTDVKFQPLGKTTALIPPDGNLVLAVMDLDPQGIEPGVARAVSDMLRNEIGGSSGVRLVDRTRIEQILKEQDFQHSGRTDQAMAAQIGKILNARKMIFGSVSKLGTSITISTQMLDVETAAVEGRGILCQQCALEELPRAVAELRPWIVADSSQPLGRAILPPSRPRISIISPSQNLAIQNNQVEIKADIEDDTGIKSAELLVNGGFDKSQRIMLSPGDKPGVGAGRSLKVERTLTLEPGTNIVALRVENVPGIVEEESRIIRVTTAGKLSSKTAAPGKRWALIVGVSKYQDPKIPRLDYADQDARALSDALSSSTLGGFSAERKLVLLNEQATTAGITKALRSFLQKPDVDDTVVIYLAGHGAPDPKRPDNVYFITHDTQIDDIAGTALPMREIEIALKENLMAQRVVVLSDACHSEAIGTKGRRDLVYSASESTNRALDEMVRRSKPGTAIFTSARSGETSLEGHKWGGGHGVFTWFLLQGLQGSADLNKDGVISLDELFTYVKDQVKQETRDQQHPVVVSESYDPQLPIAVIPVR
ncbi:MAG TPA: caspase family protein, partial [Candidatus Angelobacter sp.]|nr:caspase family protein [Candidatus Angelobacter sp.]